MTPEEKRQYDRNRRANRTPEQIEKDKETLKSYRDKNKEKIKTKAKVVRKNITPKQHLEKLQYERELYANRTPEQIEKDKSRHKNTNKKYRSKLENKKKTYDYNKKYSQEPEVVKKRKIYQAKRRQIQEVIDYGKKYEKDNRKRLNQNSRYYNEDMRFEVCLAYSKRHSNSDIPCCRCCGENTDVRFLAMDHIQGRKNLPKKEAGLSGDKLILFLKKNNCPEGYQVLCHNCNSAKGHSKDNKCPHQRN
jgi:hypothetical protein